MTRKRAEVRLGLLPRAAISANPAYNPPSVRVFTQVFEEEEFQ
jgi:hypothetical protein